MSPTPLIPNIAIEVTVNTVIPSAPAKASSMPKAMMATRKPMRPLAAMDSAPASTAATPRTTELK